MINIDKLNYNIKKKKERKDDIYKDILKLVHRRILNAAETNNDGYCYYSMPKFIYGVPLFDYRSCLLYIVKALIKNGFDIKYLHPNLLFIKWLGKENPKNYKKETTKEYRAINEYNSNINLVYNKNLINSLESKINLLKN